MPRGGKRPGAGHPKGKLQASTIQKIEVQRQFRDRIAAEIEPLADALIRAAKGVDHLQAQDKTGQWTSVTDPAIMSKVLNGPERYMRISAKDPDVGALRECFNRLFGQAPQHVEFENVTPPEKMTDEELKAKALELLAKL